MAIDLGYRLRGLATENVNLKLISLAAALTLYSLVHGSQEAQRSLLLNVVALTPPQSGNRELITPIPAQIRITVRGLRSTLDDLHVDDMGSVQLDLRSGTKSRVTFEPSMIPVPPGLTVEQIDPPAVDLTWEDRITREVPVEVGIVGAPAPGFVLKEAPLSTPTFVNARGPRSEVTVLQHARADAFDVTGLTGGKYVRQLAIDRPSGHVDYDVASVTAALVIDRETAERAFPRLPIAVLGHAPGHGIGKTQPAEVDVRLVCPPDIVRALRPEQVVPHVQIDSPAEHGSDVVAVQLSVDQCVVHVSPATVIVRW